MKVLILLLTLVIPATGVVAAQEPADTVSVTEGVDFQVFRTDGSEAALSDVLEAMDDVEVVLVGEEHGNGVGHAVEEMLLSGALDRYRPSAGTWVTLSLEMFERDVQYVVDEYLAGQITELHFLESARPWEGYAVRYRPLVELARAEGIPVVAANAPRRYVNRVTREGPSSLENLSPLARFFLPPLPYPGPSDEYRAQWDEIMAAAMQAAGAHGDSSHVRDYVGSENALQAQALWDASMGHAIAGVLAGVPGGLVLHFAGSFHVERGTGIAERIEDYRPGTRVLSVVMTTVGGGVAQWNGKAHAGLGDFVILTR